MTARLLAAMTLVGLSAAQYDCNSVGEGWSTSKISWCCRERQIGCGELFEGLHHHGREEHELNEIHIHQSAYDCSLGTSELWSGEHNEWCCNNKNVGCTEAVLPPRSHKSPWELPVILLAALALLLCGVTMVSNIFKQSTEPNSESQSEVYRRL